MLVHDVLVDVVEVDVELAGVTRARVAHGLVEPLVVPGLLHGPDGRGVLDLEDALGDCLVDGVAGDVVSNGGHLEVDNWLERLQDPLGQVRVEVVQDGRGARDVTELVLAVVEQVVNQVLERVQAERVEGPDDALPALDVDQGLERLQDSLGKVRVEVVEDRGGARDVTELVIVVVEQVVEEVLERVEAECVERGDDRLA